MASTSDSEQPTTTATPPASAPQEEQIKDQLPKHPEQTPRHWEDDYMDDSPFTLFRRYADEQISSMLQAVVGLPSAFHPPAAGNWLLFEEQQPAPAHTTAAIMSRSQDQNGGTEGQAPTDGGSTGKDDNGRDSRRSWYDIVHFNSRENGLDNPKSNDNEDQHRRSTTSRRYNSFDDFFEDTRNWFGRPFHVSSILDSSFLDWPFRSSAWFHNHFFPPPHFFDSIISSHGPGWALPYILFSPYSPIHLERRERAGKGIRGPLGSFFGAQENDGEIRQQNPQNIDWRLAFEDLLRIENGKSMLDISSKELWKKESGADWIYGMIDRGSLGDQWKLKRRKGRHGEDLVNLTYEDENSRRNWEASSSRADPSKAIEGGDNEDEATTELDVYDSILGGMDDKTSDEDIKSKDENKPSLTQIIKDKAKAFEELAASKASELTSSSSSPKVVATSVTTDRRSMPDGTIHTKTVRTKRYSDGHEERTESVETTNPRDGEGSGKSGSSWF